MVRRRADAVGVETRRVAWPLADDVEPLLKLGAQLTEWVIGPVAYFCDGVK